MTTLSYKSPDADASKAAYSPVLHLLAMLTAAATLLLIFMGGLVTSHGAGMSVPDWPNSYGYNMFTFPPSKWIGGIFYEHTHRLMGTVVGLLSIAMVVVAFRVEPRRWVRWLSVAVLLAVIVQGVLGGLRVVLVELDLAIIHGCIAQACLCLMALMSVVTSRWWLTTSPVGGENRRLVYLAVGCGVMIYAQLIVGAMMRHYGAGLAIPDLPLNYGQVLPPMDAQSLADANAHRVSENLPAVTFFQVWLHFGHRMGAVLVTILLSWLIARLLRHESSPALRRPAMLLIGLLITQLTLGVLTVLWRKPADVASLHVLVGALTLMTTFVLIVRSVHLYPIRRPELADGPQEMLVPA